MRERGSCREKEQHTLAVIHTGIQGELIICGGERSGRENKASSITLTKGEAVLELDLQDFLKKERGARESGTKRYGGRRLITVDKHDRGVVN